MALSASEQARRVREMMQQTHGVGLTETQRVAGQGAAGLGKNWGAKIKDWRGLKRVPALLQDRRERTSEAGNFKWCEETVVIFPAFGEHPIAALDGCVAARSFDPPVNTSGKKSSTVRLDPEQKGAVLELEPLVGYPVKCVRMATRSNLAQAAGELVWLDGVQIVREFFEAKPKKEDVGVGGVGGAGTGVGAASRRGGAGAGAGIGVGHDDNDGALAAAAAEDAAAGAAHSPYKFSLYVAQITSMTEDEKRAAWEAYDAMDCVANPIRVDESARYRECMRRIMGDEWVANASPYDFCTDRYVCVRVDNSADVPRMLENGEPVRLATFEPLLQLHWDTSFSRKMGRDPATQVERPVVQISRLGLEQGPIVISAYQSPGGNVPGRTVNMHTTIYPEDIYAFGLSLDEWREFGPTLYQCFKGRYLGRRTADLSGLPDSGVDEIHVNVSGHMLFDVAETVTEAGFVLSAEQVQAQFPDDEIAGEDPYVPPAAEVTGRMRHIATGTGMGARVVNLSRTTGNIAKLKAAVAAGDASIVRLAPMRLASITVRAGIRNNPDRDAALQTYMQDKFYPQVGLDEQANKLPPPMIFFAVAKTGAVARFIEPLAPQPAVAAGAGAGARAGAAASAKRAKVAAEVM